MLEKIIEFAQTGNGRRLLNALNRKDIILTSFELDEVLRIYREVGLPREVEILKRRRGILRGDQYDALAREVRENCCPEKFDAFGSSLRNLLSCGMKMNPARTDMEGPV